MFIDDKGLVISMLEYLKVLFGAIAKNNLYI